MSQVYIVTKPVNIEEVLPSEKILSSPISKEISALIEGRGWDLLFEFLFKKELLIKQVPKTASIFNITSEEIKRNVEMELNDNDLRVLNINVDSKVIPIEDKISKIIPLYLSKYPPLEKGHQLADSVSFIPSHIEITGPESIIEQMDKWPVIYETDLPLKATKSERIKVVMPNPPVSIAIQEVEMTIPVEAFTEKTLFVPVQVNNLSKKEILIFPEKIQITVLVGLSKFNQTSPDEFKLAVTYDDVQNENIQFLPIEIESKPNWVSHLRLSSQNVRYFIIK